MQTCPINLTLWSVSALLVCAAVAAIALGIAMPLETDASANAPTTQATRGASAATSPQLAAFEPIFQRPLRQSLTDAPSGVAASAATEAGAQITLAGTIGNSLALLRRADGSIEVKAVGESIDGSEVLDVRPGEVDLRVNGQKTTLCKPREPEP